MRSAQGKDQAHAAVRRITGELAGLAERAATGAERLLGNARRALRRRRSRLRRWWRPVGATPPPGAAAVDSGGRSMT
jgi:IS5 family transposase